MIQENIRNDLDNISLLVLLSGVMLIPLLPIGSYLGISTSLYQAVFLIHLLFLTGALIYSLRYIVREAGRSFFNMIFIGVPLLILFAFVESQTILPITAKDALIHHLYIPRLWVENGRIFETNWHEWSYYPELIQLAYAAIISFDLTQLTPFYHSIYLFILCGVTAIFVERGFDSRRYGIWAYLITLSTPMLIKLGGEPLVDIPLALFCGIAVSLLIEACQGRFAGQRLLGAGVAIGLALSTKYNGLLWAFVLMASFPVYCWRIRILPKSIFRMCLILGAIALITYSPWLIRNFVWKGNPIYPLLSGHLMDAQSSPNFVGANSLSPLIQRVLLYGETWIDILAMPFRMILTGADENPAKFDAVLSPIFIILFVGLGAISFRSWSGWVGFIVVSYFVLAIVATGARSRYLLPIWVPTLGLVFLGLHQLKKLFPKYGTRLKQSLLFLHALWVINYLVDLGRAKNLVDYITTDQTQESYLSTKLSEYDLIKKVNEQTVENQADRIYLLGTGNRFFYFINPVISSHYSQKYLLEGMSQVDSNKLLAEWFIKRGVRFLLVNRVRADTLLSSSLSDDQKVIWQQFITENMVERVKFGAYSLFYITP